MPRLGSVQSPAMARILWSYFGQACFILLNICGQRGNWGINFPKLRRTLINTHGIFEDFLDAGKDVLSAFTPDQQEYVFHARTAGQQFVYES